jgi:tetratricopeptide (TPR) repeat protein
MPGPALSDRDLAILRSFASRIDPSDAGAHNNLGVLYYQKGMVGEAVAAFSRALEIDSRMQVAEDNLELAYRESGFYDGRVAELQERLRRTPDDREARWELGRAYASLSRHDLAAQAFEELLARSPSDVPALIHLGLSEKARGRIEAAGGCFALAAELDPGSAVARFYQGETLYNRGLNDAALEALEAAIRHNPDYAEAHYLLAFVYGDMGLHERALEATKRAIALNPMLSRAQANLSLERLVPKSEEAGRAGKAGRAGGAGNDAAGVPLERDPLAHYQLGLAFRQKRYFAEALREYRLALDAGEDRSMVLQAMAEVHLLRRDHAAALELYDELLRQNPRVPKLWNERGVCLHQAGRRDEAATAYEHAITADRTYALAWNNLGVLRAGASGADAALAAFRSALERQPALHAARLNLALVLMQRRQPQAALEAYREVLSRDHANAVAWNGVGLVLMELKRYTDARNAFGRAVEHDPALAAAHYNLSFTLGQLGDFEGALRETKRALELESYYVPQKFALTIDLQYEDPTIAIAPDVATDVGLESLGGEFAFDPGTLDDLFEELAPPEAPVAAARAEDPLTLARDYLSKGLLELATAEVTRAQGRGAGRAEAQTLLGEIYARRGLHGEALERFRTARESNPGDRSAALGELRALVALERAAEGATLAEQLLEAFPRDVEVLMTVAARAARDGRCDSCAQCAAAGTDAGPGALRPPAPAGAHRSPPG